MAMTNYFQPMLAALASYDCSIYENVTMTNLTDVSSSLLVNTSSELPWACDQYNGQLLYATLYGITSAAYVLLTTLVLADLLGADKFTNAFGLLLLFQGVATFIGPPIVGKHNNLFVAKPVRLNIVTLKARCSTRPAAMTAGSC